MTVAHCRHRATVLTISGLVDATNAERVNAYAARCALDKNAVRLDLSGDPGHSCAVAGLIDGVQHR